MSLHHGIVNRGSFNRCKFLVQHLLKGVRANGLGDDLQAGMRAVPDEPEAIRRLLVDAFERFRTGNLSFAAPTERLRRFHRRELARQLADCFDEVVGRVVEGGSQYQGHAS